MSSASTESKIVVGVCFDERASAASALEICHSICNQDALLVWMLGVPKNTQATVASEIKNESLSTEFRAREYRNACVI